MAFGSARRSASTKYLRAGARQDSGSIIVVLATDAPLLPIQCQRLARRASTGLAWVGGIGANSSGDLFLAFSTATGSIRLPRSATCAWPRSTP
jgi:L-aminopeptidase/D-esterase-like protein